MKEIKIAITIEQGEISIIFDYDTRKVTAAQAKQIFKEVKRTIYKEYDKIKEE